MQPIHEAVYETALHIDLDKPVTIYSGKETVIVLWVHPLKFVQGEIVGRYVASEQEEAPVGFNSH